MTSSAGISNGKLLFDFLTPRPLADSTVRVIRQAYHSLKEALCLNSPDPPAPPGSQMFRSPLAPHSELEVVMAQSLLTLVSAVGGEELPEAVPLEDVVEILRSVVVGGALEELLLCVYCMHGGEQNFRGLVVLNILRKIDFADQGSLIVVLCSAGHFSSFIFVGQDVPTKSTRVYAPQKIR